MVYRMIFLILQTNCKEITLKLQIIVNNVAQKYEYFIK
jgi:hypothetical protein